MLAGLGPLCPRGPEDGPPALVLPGFLATDRTTMDLLCERVSAVGGGRKVLLVGWSLGGMFARELAHRCPENIRAVVTLGSPFSGDLKTNTNVCALYERIAGHDVNEPPFERFATKPPVPTLAFWSRRDGIVAPSAARGLRGESDRAVELDTYHVGFAVHRPVLSRVVADIETFLTEVEGRSPVVPYGACI
jgi:pimeloyl-ACP methyl ester carboxylesterase